MERIFQFSTPFLNIFYLFLFCRCKKWNCWKVGKELSRIDGSLYHFSDVYRHVIFKKDVFTQICLIVSPYSWRTSIVKKFHALKCCIFHSGFSLKTRAALWIQHHPIQTRQQPRGTDCAYTMLSQSTMVCPTNYAKNSKLKRQHIKTRKLLGPLLYLFLIDDIFFNNLIVMVVNPVQAKLFPFTSCRREKKGKGGGEPRRAPFYTLRSHLWLMIQSPKLHRIMCSTFLIKI